MPKAPISLAIGQSPMPMPILLAMLTTIIWFPLGILKWLIMPMPTSMINIVVTTVVAIIPVTIMVTPRSLSWLPIVTTQMLSLKIWFGMLYQQEMVTITSFMPWLENMWCMSLPINRRWIENQCTCKILTRLATTTSSKSRGTWQVISISGPSVSLQAIVIGILPLIITINIMLMAVIMCMSVWLASITVRLIPNPAGVSRKMSWKCLRLR